MATFVKLGNRQVNADHIAFITEESAASPAGTGRKVRVDVIGVPSEYFSDAESLAALDQLLGKGKGPQPRTKAVADDS